MPLALPAVSVTARSTTEFDISFTGDEGYNEQPALDLLDTSNQQVQQIEFTPTQAMYGASGTFTLTTGKGTTSAINFNSFDLGTVATQVKAALVALGYSPSTSVTASYSANTTEPTANATSPYTLTITWSGPIRPRA